MNKSERLYIRVSPELKKKIQQAAESENRTISNWIENLLITSLYNNFRSKVKETGKQEENKMNVNDVEKAFLEKLREGDNLRFYICDTYYLDLSGCIMAITECEESEPTEINVYAGNDGCDFYPDNVIWRDEVYKELGKIVVSAEGNILSYNIWGKI